MLYFSAKKEMFNAWARRWPAIWNQKLSLK